MNILIIELLLFGAFLLRIGVYWHFILFLILADWLGVSISLILPENLLIISELLNFL